MSNEVVRLKLDNIALKMQVLETQYAELKQVASNLQTERSEIIEGLRKQNKAGKKDTFNPMTLTFDKSVKKLKKE